MARLLGNTRRRISVTWLFAAAIVLGIFAAVVTVFATLVRHLIG